MRSPGAAILRGSQCTGVAQAPAEPGGSSSHRRSWITFTPALTKTWDRCRKGPAGGASPEPHAKYIPTWMPNWGIRALHISHLHALAVGDLPLHHLEPFDRILIVQSRMEEMVLLTADRMFEKYSAKTFWCGT
jgi:hypothetical protein